MGRTGAAGNTNCCGDQDLNELRLCCMHPQEARDVVEVCCRQRIPVQLLFAGARQPVEGRFVELEGESLWLELVPSSVTLVPDTPCSLSFQQATSTVVLVTSLLEVGAGRRSRFALPSLAVLAGGRQFFRVPVAESSRLLTMVSDDAQRWFIGSPLDLSLGGLQVALFEEAPTLAVGTRLVIDLVLELERARMTGRIVRRIGRKLGVQLIPSSTDTPKQYREIVGQVERRWLATVFEAEPQAAVPAPPQPIIAE
jgi:PilZ domain